jgi:hypothetical protein
MIKFFFSLLRTGSRHRKNLEEILSRIVVNGNILDVGGAQRPISTRISKNSRVKKVEILDLPSPHNSDSSTIDLAYDIQKMTENDLNLISRNYNAIFCTEVSLYWYDPAQAIRNISKIMSKNTILYINFHQNYAIQRPSGLDTLRYTFNGIEKLITSNSLYIEEVIPTNLNRVSKIALLAMWRSEKMRKDPGYMNHFVSSFFVKVRKYINE